METFPVSVLVCLGMNEEEASALVAHIKNVFFLFAVPQSELFPDKLHGGRVFYNEAIMSAMGLPQVQWHGEYKGCGKSAFLLLPTKSSR